MIDKKTNSFIDYLNSLHNASAGNEGALAESQVCNEYYEKICIERKVGDILLDKINGEKPVAIILTGHAGDGKTSLVIQILKNLNSLPFGKRLKEKEFVSINTRKRQLLYVKDMSELTSEEQEDYLKEVLESPCSDNSSILVSNTGPLINTFKRLFFKKDFSKEEIEDIEMQLLDKMDMAGLQELELNNYKFYILNVARVDNVNFVPKIIGKFIQEDLWVECNDCLCKDRCPIHNNYVTVKTCSKRLSHFCQDFYRWLYEHDKRMTIRQIIAHFAFGFTGGLSCKNVEKKPAINLLFDYHFANLFFGFKGDKEIQNALQVRGVRELQSLGIDRQSFSSKDYILFVKGDFTCFGDEIQLMLQNIWEKFSCNYDVHIAESYEHINLRRSLRRFYLLFSKLLKNEYEEMLNESFSPIYVDYLNARTSKSNSNTNKFRNLINCALYRIFVGYHPPNGNQTLYLTIRRENLTTPNVQMIQGQLDYNSIKVEQIKNSTDLDSESESYLLHIKTERLKKTFPISLQLLDYFKKVLDGGVSTNINPYLSYGLDKLKTELTNAYQCDPEESKLLVHTLKGNRIFSLNVEDKNLVVYY